LQYGPTFDRSLLTLQLTNEESVSRNVSVQTMDILNTVCEQTLANDLHFFMCFWFKWLLSIVSAFYSERNARIASAVLAIAIPSVRLSVCSSHAGIVSKRRHVARCSLHG